MRNYFSAHNHTEFSNLRLLDSINKIPALIKRAYELNLKGLAITDHEALSGHVQAIQFYQNFIKENNIDSNDFKLVLGDEIYIKGEDKYYHFILLAKNKEGHRALREISSVAWTNYKVENGMERVYLTHEQFNELIQKHKGKLIGATACLGGELPKLILDLHKARTQNGNVVQAQLEIDKYIKNMLNLFGDDFYLEIQPSFTEEQVIVNQTIKNIAKFYDIKIIVTTDSHYLKKEDREIHKAYLTSMEGEREVDDFYTTAYMMSQEEIWEYLKNTFTQEEFEEIIKNTHEIANKCEVYDLARPQVVPAIDVKDRLEQLKEKYKDFIINEQQYPYLYKMLKSKYEQDNYWLYACINGLYEKVFNKREVNKELYLKRLDIEAKELWEISEIINNRMTQYYNTMQKIIEIVWDKGESIVGPARGSATGFLSCYALGITQVDPIVWNLPHWRHLSAERPELPDIDFDTMASRRQQILQAVKEFFCPEPHSIFGRSFKVLNIATFGTEGPKSACLTACRGYRSKDYPNGIEPAVAQYLTSMIPTERGQTWPLHHIVYGDEETERKPVHAFINEVNKYPGLLDIMFAIEGIVNKRSIHASGIYIYTNEDGFLEFNAMMCAPNGQPITQWNMGDSDYMGSLKYDFLTVEALDKIGVCLDLLLKDKQIEWQGSLKATYDKYLHPDILEYTDKKMWDLMGENEVIDLFQFNTVVGLQCAKKLQPHSVIEAAAANSLMRLMGEPGKETPLEKYIRFKENIQLWYDEMDEYGLTKEEQKVLEKYLLPVYGVANTQEDIMEMVMEEKIANFNVKEANKLRKGIAKKKAAVIQEAKELFYKKGLENGARKELLDYVWDTQITPQLGYSFSRNHTLPYTIIALQELNLYYKYHPIYWNTACLTVNAGSFGDDMEDEVSKNADYVKIATAINDIKSRGIQISLLDINKSDYSFKPDIENNRILYGFKGVSNVGDDLIKSIIENRPYSSMEDFLKKVNINKVAMVNLIKGGAFDSIENCSREEIMKKYISSIAGLKKKLTLQNLSSLINYEVITPTSFEARLFNFNKALKQFKQDKYYIFPHEQFTQFYNEFFDESLLTIYNNYPAIEIDIWDKIYKNKINETIKTMLKNPKIHDFMLNKLNEKIFMEEWNKYCEGNISSWEMDALGFYYHEHELANVDKTIYNIVDFNELPEQPEVEKTYKRNGVEMPIYKLHRIVGTVIGKNKTKGMVYLLLPNGTTTILKFRNEQFAFYDKKLTQVRPDGSKETIEEGWFKKGTKLMITGFRREDSFIPKTYANTIGHTVYKILSVDKDGKLDLVSRQE